jgi:hypothetical protein
MGVAKYMQVNIYYRKHRGKQWNPTIYIMINKKYFSIKNVVKIHSPIVSKYSGVALYVTFSNTLHFTV